jgi:hypothetical protein
MTNHSRFGLMSALRDHLLSGHAVTVLDAIVLFGVPSLTKLISDMRREGWVIKSRTVPYVAAMSRVRAHAVLEPPANLPVKDVVLTEYWVSR